MAWTFFPLSTAPAPCSIVWCRFPYVEEQDKPGPKSRPGIVKRVSGDQDGNPWVHVAYGTTKSVFRHGLENFTISNVSEMDICGLWCATRFRLDRVALLPWCSEFFKDAPGRQSPVMGRLSEHGVSLLRYQGARLAKQESEQQAQLPLDSDED
ncbi:MAG TPA: hypothetical protein VF503_33090 [Sphingobium sp.]|uniref:hypothetical protein n=1 Tax=Sphingobium sp. TaxID=1912891 RepID=UPI002ECFD0B8